MYITCIYLHISGIFASWGNPSGVLLPCMIRVPRALQAEKAVAPHASVLAWKIPGMGEPVGLPSMGMHRVRLDRRDLAAAAAAALQASVSATLTAVLRLSLLIPCFSRSLLPNSSQAHQHLRNLFGKFLIKSLTDGLPAKHRYSFFMFTGGPASHVGARKEVEPLQDCAPALLLERRWVPSTG